MKLRVVKILFPLLLVIMVGCVSKPMSVEQAQQIKSMALIIGMNDKLYGNFIGTTVFSNKDYVVSIEDWNPKKLISKNLIQRLEHIEIVEYESAIPFVEKASLKQANQYRKSAVDKAKAEGYAHVLIIRAYDYNNKPLRDLEGGLGVYCLSSFGIKTKQVGYVSLEFSIFDTQTAKLVHSRLVMPNMNAMNKANIKNLGEKCKKFDQSKLKETSKKHSSQFKDLLNGAIDEFVSNSNLL